MAISFVVSLGAIIGFAFFKDEWILIRILIWIFCSIFVVASGIILVQQLTCYVEVTDEYFIKHFLLAKTRIPYSKISRIINQNGFYDIYVENRKFASFTADTKEGQEIILFLEKKQIRIDW